MMKLLGQIACVVMMMILVAFCVVIFGGCTTVKNVVESPEYWDKVWQVAQQYFDAKAEHKKAKEKVAANPEATDDEKLYASFQWRHGGFNGSGAVLSNPRLSLVSASKAGITYRWDVGMSSWGYANTECGGIACIFFKDKNGNWVGGKFDWVSTSRPYRDFGHIFGATPYGNWGSLNWPEFPSTVEFAFVVVEQKGKLRSNIITGSLCDEAPPIHHFSAVFDSVGRRVRVSGV